MGNYFTEIFSQENNKALYQNLSFRASLNLYPINKIHRSLYHNELKYKEVQ